MIEQKTIWGGHSRAYFEGFPNKSYKVYTELIADYTAIRVSADNRAYKMMRQLVGPEMMNMLEKTYQDMLDQKW